MIQKRRRRRDEADGGDVLWRWRRDDEIDDGADNLKEEKDKVMMLVPTLVMEVAVRSREARMRMALLMALPLTEENRDKRRDRRKQNSKEKEGRKCPM